MLYLSLFVIALCAVTTIVNVVKLCYLEERAEELDKREVALDERAERLSLWEKELDKRDEL